jgi:hypothetical protein
VLGISASVSAKAGIDLAVPLSPMRTSTPRFGTCPLRDDGAVLCGSGAMTYVHSMQLNSWQRLGQEAR